MEELSRCGLKLVYDLNNQTLNYRLSTVVLLTLRDGMESA